MKILFLGDISGRAGRGAACYLLHDLKEELGAELCIANGENAAGGFGLSRDAFDELSRAGVDVFTMGNHVWGKKEVVSLMEEGESIIRPFNFPAADPGEGVAIFKAESGERAAVINLIGRLYIELPAENPFFAAERAIEGLPADIKTIFIDFHAEATSEKAALAWHLDGRASAVIGTHTHVQTADEQILPKGTAFMTDAGMTGPLNSVLGINPAGAIGRFTASFPTRFEMAGGEALLCGVFIRTNPETGMAEEIKRIRLAYPKK